MHFCSCSNARHSSHSRRPSNRLYDVYVAFLLICSFGQPCRADGGNSTSGGCDKSKIEGVVVAGATKDRFVAIIKSRIMDQAGSGRRAFCAYDMPLKALKGKKLYLSGGSELVNKWPDLSTYFRNDGDKFAGVTLLDAQHSWIYLTTGTYAKILNLDTKKVVDIFLFNSTGSYISSTKVLEMFQIHGPMHFGITKWIFTGSKTLTEVQSLKQDLEHSFFLCLTDESHINALKWNGSCQNPLPKDWSYFDNGAWSGFNDGKKFYVPGTKHMYIFDQSVFGSKLGQSVPFEKVERSKFFVYGTPGLGPNKPDDPSNEERGGDDTKKGHSNLAIIIVVFVLLVIFAVALYFLWFKPNNKDSKKGGPSKDKSLMGKGKRSGSQSKAGKVAGGKSFKLSKRNSLSRGGSSKSKKTSIAKLSGKASSKKLSKKGTSISKKAPTPSVSRKSTSRKASQSRKLSGTTSRRASQSRKLLGTTSFSKARTTRSKGLGSRKMSKSRKA